MDRRTLLRSGLPFVAVGLTGCTGGGTETPTDAASSSPTSGDAGTDSPTATSGGTDTESSTATNRGETDTPTDGDGTDTASPTASETSTATAPDLEVVVGPNGTLTFDPRSFEIAVGDTVRWVWDSGGHNVSPGSQPSGADWPGKDESTYSAGTTYEYTFDVAGDYNYHCDPHQTSGMTGSFTVTG